MSTRWLLRSQICYLCACLSHCRSRSRLTKTKFRRRRYSKIVYGFIYMRGWLISCTVLAKYMIFWYICADIFQWISVDELLKQEFYEDDEMSKWVIEICMQTYEKNYSGFFAHQVISKFDGKLSYLYYKHVNIKWKIVCENLEFTCVRILLVSVSRFLVIY